MTKSDQLAVRLLEAEAAESAWTFTVQLQAPKNIDVIDYFEGDDYDEAEANLAVTWEADIDVRSWGIKGITPVVKKVWGQITLLHPDTGDTVSRIPISWPVPPSAEHLQQVLGEPPRSETDVKAWAGYYGSSQKEWYIDTTCEPDPHNSHALSVTSATISLRERTITIAF